MGRGPGGGGTGANGQDRERMGRDDREEEQGAGGERGGRREEEADRGRIDRTLPHLYTIYSPVPPHSVFVCHVPHAAHEAKNVMLCHGLPLL